MSQKALQRVKVMENAAGGRLSRIVSMRRTSAHALTFGRYRFERGSPWMSMSFIARDSLLGP